MIRRCGWRWLTEVVVDHDRPRPGSGPVGRIAEQNVRAAQARVRPRHVDAIPEERAFRVGRQRWNRRRVSGVVIWGVPFGDRDWVDEGDAAIIRRHRPERNVCRLGWRRECHADPAAVRVFPELLELGEDRDPPSIGQHDAVC